MIEQSTILHPKTDKLLFERYNKLVQIGRDLLSGSALVDPEKVIQYEDLLRIHLFHHYSSPVDPDNTFRLYPKQEFFGDTDIVDPSTYANWEAKGGPLESINLASQAAIIITRNLQDSARSSDKPDELKNMNPYHLGAAAALHDEGRQLTHIYYTNELIGNLLLRKIGVREDIIELTPDEDVMLVPPDESMEAKISSLPLGAVIVRIADEFGKRFPGSTRVYQPEDYTDWDRNTWANRYMQRPSSGRASDDFMRKEIDNITRMQLHVNNVPRYFEALDAWVRSVSTLTLKDITTILQEKLSDSL